MTPSLDNAVQRLDRLEEMLHTLIRTVGTLGGKVSDIEKPSRRRFGAARARDYPVTAPSTATSNTALNHTT
jgi:hypothetical protein